VSGGVARRRGGLIGLVLLVAVALSGAAAVSVWALARPGADPLGAAAARLAQGAGDWLARLRQRADDPVTDWAGAAFQVGDGDPVQGARLIARYGCGACHSIPGVPRAHGSVGPDLAGFRRQAYIAGVLPNRPGALVDWLQSPPRHAPQTAMPDMGITEAEAEHMAAYLYTLGHR
jgi:cytochrome c2